MLRNTFEKSLKNNNLGDIQNWLMPICSTGIDGRTVIVGYELLARRIQEDGSGQTPFHFIDDINAKNLRTPLELTSLEDAFALLKTIEGPMQTIPGIYISVNLCPNTLAQTDLLEQIENIENTFPNAKDHIKLEILEHSFTPETETIIHQNLRALHARGYKLLMDDYCNNLEQDKNRLEGLKDIIDGVKLDRKFWNLDDFQKDSVINEILTIKPSASLVFEFIDTDEQIAYCNKFADRTHVMLQGFHKDLGQAAPKETFFDFHSHDLS